MTLHWWMHWFWVTSLITLHANLGTAAPSDEPLHVTTDAPPERQSGREGRAMYFTKTVPLTTSIPPNTTENHTEDTPQTTIDNTTTEHTVTNLTEIHPSIVWTAINASDIAPKNDTETVTETQNTTTAPKKRNLTRPDVVKDDLTIEGVSESRIVTEKPLSLETTFLQTRIPNIESSRRVVDEGMDTGAIAGISFAALVLVALAGSTAFVLYRRRYLNKPQTLNDKCSNPDSSGYLDDSTIRDNSEEMYSLDNDSFLNSLEAMTIQNYWTDTVKHTKL